MSFRVRLITGCHSKNIMIQRSNLTTCNFFRIKVWMWLLKDWIHWKTWHMIWMRSVAFMIFC